MQNPNPNKDEWIQEAKALLYIVYLEGVDGREEELKDLIKRGGGFDPTTESKLSKLKWRK